MTQNQLKFWELRWKQHYENILAKVEVAKVEETRRHNLAVEIETARHNRREERIDTQNMIINRGNLAARWAELEEKQRAALVAEALNQKQYELQVQRVLSEIKLNSAKVQEILTNRDVAIADLAINAAKVKAQNAQGWIEAYAKALDVGWGEAAVTKFAQTLETQVSNAPIDNAMRAFAEKNPDYNWSEIFGPAYSSEIVDVSARHPQPGSHPVLRGESQYQKFKNRMASAPGAFDDEIGPGVAAKASGQASVGYKSPSLPQSGTTTYNLEKTVTKSTNTPVSIGGPTSTNRPTQSNIIYSPGVKVGPGW